MRTHPNNRLYTYWNCSMCVCVRAWEREYIRVSITLIGFSFHSIRFTLHFLAAYATFIHFWTVCVRLSPYIHKYCMLRAHPFSIIMSSIKTVHVERKRTGEKIQSKHINEDFQLWFTHAYQYVSCSHEELCAHHLSPVNSLLMVDWLVAFRFLARLSQFL